MCNNFLVMGSYHSLKLRYEKFDNSTKINEQLKNEAEYLMKNYGDRGGCYWPRLITPSLFSPILMLIL